MASNRTGRYQIALALSLCIQSQLSIPLAAQAQGAAAEVPTAPTGTPEPPLTSPAMPSPTVPGVASIITPDVSAILNQSVPSPTAMVVDFAQNSTLNFSGDFINPANVTLYAISTDPNITTATISAANIYNAGIITTILPSGGLPGYTNLVGNLNLVLNAVNNIVNIGEISSAGNLSMTAGNAIANVTSSAGVSAVMSAANNVSLTANNMVNSGTIGAVNNLNLSSVMANNLAVNAVGGMFQAGGAINIRDAAFTAKSNLDVLGGIWSSPAFNFNSGNGTTKMALESASGLINGSTGELYLSSVATLNLGNVEILGDPSFSSDGDLFLGSVSANEAITAHASGSIFAGSLVADGGAISLQAGGTVSASGSLQSTHSIYIIGSTVSAAGTVMSAGDFIHIGGDVIDVSGASLTAGSSVDFYATTLVANDAQITAGDSISVVGNDVGSVSLNNAVMKSGNNFGIGSGQISAIDAAITATGQVYLGTSAGNISAANLQVTAQDSVTIDAINGGVDLSGSSIKSNGGNVFVYGNQSVSLGDLIDTTGPSGGGRIFVASVNGSVNAPVEGFITTGPNPLVPPPGFFEISINAKESVSVGHLTSGGGNVSVQSGSLIERNGGAVLAFVTQEGAGSTKVTEINTSGLFTTRGDVEVFGAEGGVKVGTITGNGLSVLVDSRGSLSLESVNNDILDDRGGYNTIKIVAISADPLAIHEGIISANGVFGGGLVDITNYGIGGVSINSDSIAIAATESGSGGALFVTSGSWINVNGDLAVDGKELGAGGIVELNALGGDIVVTGKMSANGAGEGMSGGRIVLSSLTGDVTIGGGAVTLNGKEGDGGGFSARAFGTVNVPSISANGGGAAGSGGSISISGANVASSNLNLDANGSGSGSGGRVWIQLDDSFDARSGVTISAHGGASGNGGNLLLTSGHDLQVDSAKWNLAAGTNGNGGSVTLESGRSGEMSKLSIAGAVNVDGNGVGNGGLIEIKARGEDSDFSIGAEGNATVLSARSGAEDGNGGSITVTASGDLTATASALRAYTRGPSGDGGYYELRAGASGGGPIGTAAFALDGSAEGAGPFLTVTGTLNADAAQSGQGGKIIASSSGDGASVDLHDAKLFARGGGVSGNGGSVSVTATESIDLGVTNISVSAKGGGDGGRLEITGGSLLFDNDKISLTADGGVTGRGGAVYLIATGTSNSGGGDDGGGIIGAFLLAAAAPVPTFIISARSKDLTSSGGTILLSMAQDDVSIQDFSQFTINGNGAASNITLQAKSLSIGSSSTPVSILARGTNGDTPIIQLSSLEGGLTVYGNLNASGTNDAAGGIIGLNAIGGNLVFVGNANVDGAGTGGGGSITFSAVGDNASVQIGEVGSAKNITARGGASGGNGGLIEVHADGDIVLNGSFLSAGARGGNAEGGPVTIEAGIGGTGMVRSLGNINTVGRGSGKGGNITIDFKSEESLVMASNGKGELLAFSEAGIGGDITIHNQSADLNVRVNDTVSVLSRAGGSGTITFLTAGDKIELSGPGTLQGDVVANEKSDVSIKLSGKTVLDVKEISSETGNVHLELTANGSKVSLASATRALEATKGDVILKASEISNLDSGKEIKAASKLELSSAGALKVSSNGGKLTLLDSAPSLTRRIDIMAASISFEGTQLDMDTSRASNPGGDVTIDASTGNISNSGLLKIKTDGFGAGTISVTSAQGSTSLKNVDFSAQTFGSAAKTGAVYVSAFENVTIYGTINASSSTTSSDPGQNQPGGTITLTGVQVLAPAEKNLNLIATGGEAGGGKVEIISSKALNLSRIQIDVSVLSAKGAGGSVTLNTAGALAIGGAVDVSGRGTGAGGTIEMRAGNINLASHLLLNADGGDKGHGGDVSVNVSNGALKLGPAENALTISVLGGQNVESGTIDVKAAKGLVLDVGGIIGTGVQASAIALTAGSSSSLTLNGSLRAEGAAPTIQLKGGDVVLKNGISVKAEGSGASAIGAGTIRLIADNAQGTDKGNVVLNNSTIATGAGGRIEIASTGANFNLDLKGSVKTGTTGTVVIRNSNPTGNLNVKLFPTDSSPQLQAGRIALSSTGSISFNAYGAPQNAAVFSGQISAGTVASADSFFATGALDGAAGGFAGHVNLGNGPGKATVFPLLDIKEVKAASLETLSNQFLLNGAITVANDAKISARLVKIDENNSVRSSHGSLTFTGFLDNGPQSGRLIFLSSQTTLTASQRIDFRADTLFFANAIDGPLAKVDLFAGGSVSIGGNSGPSSAVTLLSGTNLTSFGNNADISINVSSLTLHDGAEIRSGKTLAIVGNNTSISGTGNAKGSLFGNSVRIENTGSLAINNMNIRSETTIRILSTPVTSGPALFLDSSKISALGDISIHAGTPRTDQPGSAVPNLTIVGNVFLNNTQEQNSIFAGHGTSSLLTTGPSKVNLSGSAAGEPEQAIRLDNMQVQAGALLPIAFSETRQENVQVLSAKDLYGIAWGASLISHSDNRIRVNYGDVLITAKKNVCVSTPTCDILIKRGSTVRVCVSNDEFTIDNLHDETANAVRICRDGQVFSLHVGSEFSTANMTPLAKRNIGRVSIGGLNGTTAEVSIPDFLSNRELGKSLRFLDTQTFARILKTAACLYAVTNDRGRYSK